MKILMLLRPRGGTAVILARNELDRKRHAVPDVVFLPPLLSGAAAPGPGNMASEAAAAAAADQLRSGGGGRRIDGECGGARQGGDDRDANRGLAGHASLLTTGPKRAARPARRPLEAGLR